MAQGGVVPSCWLIVTNLNKPAKAVVRFYNQRGTAEQWIKEGKNAVRWTRLSCHDFVDNGQVDAVCSGLQSGELFAASCLAAFGESLDADDLAGKADQDRSQGGDPCPKSDLPDGGGGGSTGTFPIHFEGYRPAKRACSGTWLNENSPRGEKTDSTEEVSSNPMKNTVEKLKGRHSSSNPLKKTL
jgi:hypothetical protein